MRSISELLGRAPAAVEPDLEDLVALPPTDQVLRGLERLQAALAEPHEEWALARLSAQIRRQEEQLRDCRARDVLQADRPAGCWCLGLGGRWRVYVPPDDAATALVEDLAWCYREHCGCAAGVARADSDRERQDAVARQLRSRRNARVWGSAGVPPHLAAWSLDSYPVTDETSAIVNAVRAWVTSQRWLLLHGGYGVGKSGLAVGVLRQLVEDGRVGLFVTVPDLLARLRQTFGGRPEDGAEADVMASLVETDVLVLDDMGAERMSGWVSETIFRLVNARHDWHRRTIVTSNLEPGDLSEHIGERTMWRILELADVLHVRGPNLREGAVNRLVAQRRIGRVG